MSRSPLRAALPVVLLSGLLLPRLSSGPAQEALVIKGGTIIPVSGPSVAGGSLVIEKGRITALGKTVKTPAGPGSSTQRASTSIPAWWLRWPPSA